MQEIRQKLLKKMRPGSLAADDAKWQQQKSGQTRLRIFEAAIDSLVENGYAGMSIPDVCMRSGVSRGALHHHFSERAQLVEALTEYLFNKRVIRHLFCKTCGIESFAYGQMPDGTPMVAVNVNCLDGVEPRELTPHHYDGRAV